MRVTTRAMATLPMSTTCGRSQVEQIFTAQELESMIVFNAELGISIQDLPEHPSLAHHVYLTARHAQDIPLDNVPPGSLDIGDKTQQVKLITSPIHLI